MNKGTWTVLSGFPIEVDEMISKNEQSKWPIQIVNSLKFLTLNATYKA